MKRLYSFTLFLTIPLCFHFCSEISSSVTEGGKPKKIKVLVQCIDGENNSIEANLTYEQQDCEYDFSAPKSIGTNKKGIAILSLEPGYLQLYAQGFIHESYQCGFYSKDDTIKVYAAPIPTFIKVLDPSGSPIGNEPVIYFSNVSGNCNYELNPEGAQVFTNSKGIAKIYLPQSDTYKIQVGGEAQCFQPSQTVETLTFQK